MDDRSETDPTAAFQEIPESWQRKSDPAEEEADNGSDTTPFDFIVVGAGAGGAPVAARLVERGFKVLVIEMGPKKPEKAANAVVENTEVPLLHTETTEDPRHSLRFFVKHFDHDPDGSQDPKIYRPPDDATIPGDHKDEEGIFYPRAQGVGGCTIHNAMITICGPSDDWDEIAEATGDPSWQGSKMRSYFERLEHCLYDRPLSWIGWLLAAIGFPTGWENGRHGKGGWLHTSLADLKLVKREKQFVRLIGEAAISSIKSGSEQISSLLSSVLRGTPGPALDPNHWETMRKSQAGLSMIPCSIRSDGRRSDARQRLLGAEKNHPDRLKILHGACVTKIAWEDIGETEVGETEVGGSEAKKRAIGVCVYPRRHAYQADAQAQAVPDDWGQQIKTIYCKKEVILCGGAFNTPQLLMLSGIGPREHLEENGIETFVDLAGVGSNLQDRYEVPVVAKLRKSFQSLRDLRLTSYEPDASKDPELKAWREAMGSVVNSSNPYSVNGGLLSIFARSTQETTVPDLFLFALAGRFPGYSVGYSRPSELQPGRTSSKVPGAVADDKRHLTWLVLKARTQNQNGTVRLRDNNPFRRPEINLKSFPGAEDDRQLPGESRDLIALNEAVESMKEILETGIKNGTVESIDMPGLDDFDGDELRWIKHTAWGHHACGTCKIGNGPDAVLDSRLRVRGVEGLRVVDASVFPRIFGYFIVTNVYMVAEKAADVITEDNSDDWSMGTGSVGTERDPVIPSRREFEQRRAYPTAMENVEAELVLQRRKRAGVS